MKTIGFIDYYIDEWHANNYPAFIRDSSLGSEFRIANAWAQTDPAGKTPLAEWCRIHDVTPAKTMAEVVEKSDCLVVLAPDNSEKHEELADLALRSGKPVYIDKPIAPTRAAAQRMFDKASKHGTPMMSCSALRFASVVENVLAANTSKATFAAMRGGGVYDIYAIHQVEMLVMLFGTGASRVLRAAKSGMDQMLIDYTDERRGSITLFPGHEFEFSACHGDKTVSSGALEDFFPRFIDAMLTFFRDGRSLVPTEETLEIAGIVEAGARAITTPATWVEIDATR